MSKNEKIATRLNVAVQLRDGTLYEFKDATEVSKQEGGRFIINGDLFQYIVCQELVTRITTTEEIVNEHNSYRPIDYSPMMNVPEDIMSRAYSRWQSGDVSGAILAVFQHADCAGEIEIAQWMTKAWGQPR